MTSAMDNEAQQLQAWKPFDAAAVPDGPTLGDVFKVVRPIFDAGIAPVNWNAAIDALLGLLRHAWNPGTTGPKGFAVVDVADYRRLQKLKESEGF